MKPKVVGEACCIQVRADHHSCAMGTGKLNERIAQASEIRVDQLQRVAHLQHEACVDGILARRTPMNEACRVFVLARHGFREHFHQRDSQVSGGGRFLCD